MDASSASPWNDASGTLLGSDREEAALDALAVLVEERRVLRVMSDRLRGLVTATDSPPSSVVVRALVAQVRELMCDHHHPKERTVLATHAARLPHAPPALAFSVVSAQRHLEYSLSVMQEALAQGDPWPEVVELTRLWCGQLELVQSEHHTLLYQPLIAHADDEELWSLAVDLDREMDRAGRARWRQLIDLERMVSTPDQATRCAA